MNRSILNFLLQKVLKKTVHYRTIFSRGRQKKIQNNEGSKRVDETFTMGDILGKGESMLQSKKFLTGNNWM